MRVVRKIQVYSVSKRPNDSYKMCNNVTRNGSVWLKILMSLLQDDPRASRGQVDKTTVRPLDIIQFLSGTFLRIIRIFPDIWTFPVKRPYCRKAISVKTNRCTKFNKRYLTKRCMNFFSNVTISFLDKPIKQHCFTDNAIFITICICSTILFNSILVSDWNLSENSSCTCYVHASGYALSPREMQKK